MGFVRDEKIGTNVGALVGTEGRGTPSDTPDDAGPGKVAGERYLIPPDVRASVIVLIIAFFSCKVWSKMIKFWDCRYGRVPPVL
jgi:hypothetical protein